MGRKPPMTAMAQSAGTSPTVPAASAAGTADPAHTHARQRRLLALASAVIGIALYRAGTQMARRDVAPGSDLLQAARFS